MTPRFYRLVPAVALALAAACLVVAGCRKPEGPPGLVRVSETRRLMAVPWTITLYASSAEAGRGAVAAGFAEVARLERMLSDYDPESDLSRLSAGSPTTGPVPVPDDLWRVLERAVEVRDATAGAFDPTVGPLTILWRQSRRSGRLPRADRLATARAAVGADTLVLDPVTRSVALTRAGMRLDLGGIAMGYAADRALDVIGRLGINAALVDASGDVVASGPPPGEAGWRINVAPLEAGGRDGARLLLVNAAVTTSGDAHQGVVIDGRRYSHVVDPRTGLGVAGRTAATVIAPDGATADALATAASVLGPVEGVAAIDRIPGCAGRFVWLEDGEVRQTASPGWPAEAIRPSRGDARTPRFPGLAGTARDPRGL